MTNWLADVGDLPTVLVMAALSVVMLLDAIPLIGVLIPGDVAVLGAMAARGPSGGAGVLVGVVVGCLAGWSASYLAGRYFGARIRRSRIGSWIGEKRWVAAERAVGRSGARMVMVAPFLPVLNALVPLAAGGLRMSYRRFLGSAAIGGALWGGCYVALGVLAEALGGLLPGESFTALASMGIGLTFGWVVLLGTRRKLAAEKATDEAAEPTESVAPTAVSPTSAPALSVSPTAVPPMSVSLAPVAPLSAPALPVVLTPVAPLSVPALPVAALPVAALPVGEGARKCAGSRVVAVLVGMEKTFRKAGWVREAQIPGPDRCRTPGSICGSRRRPPLAGVGASRSAWPTRSWPRRRRRPRPGVAGAGCPAGSSRRPARHDRSPAAADRAQASRPRDAPVGSPER